MRPFFVGTYFPAQDRENQISFKNLLNELIDSYKNKSEIVIENATKITETIEKGLMPKDKVEYVGHFPAPQAILDATKDYIDKENGGFGKAPKFPNFSFLEWSLEQMLDGMINKESGEFTINTIENMLMGAINDHLKGGIHRYSTDEKWQIPHFEKMLYDQAGFLRVLSKASLLYPSPIVYDSLINTLQYIESEMLNEKNYFFSSQSADSEGVEGFYFTFTSTEFEECLVKSEDNIDDILIKQKDKLSKWFQISEQGNFHSALNVVSLDPSLKKEIFTQESWDTIRKVRKSLLSERQNRIPPETDSKGIASWNFLMLSALVDVMQYCQVDVIRKIASRIFNRAIEGTYSTFVISKDENKMTIAHSTTRPELNYLFEDYVFFAEAQLRIYEITGNPTFKENFKSTIELIFREFISDDKVHTRAISTTSSELYPNQSLDSFDNSFKSPNSTFISLARRASILFSEPEFIDNISTIKENHIQESLKNPIHAGEALRALSYPDEAYRVLKVPKKWLTDQKFLNFIPYFLPRFIFDYQEENDQWQICNNSACELQGDGLDNFIETLSPKKEPPKK